MLRIRIWQWPNLLALDAALIALVWQAAFAAALGLQVSAVARLVLGLSVWLTYMADRLFDVAKRPATQLYSARHRFAKKHFRRLWGIWVGVLIADLITALSLLEATQLRNGSVLLALCLLYTALNQLLSRRFFPKEICVAVIYAGGVVVFLSLPFPWLAAGTLALLCLINCLMIGTKEQRIDAAMQVRSMTQLSSHLIVLLFAATALPLWSLHSQLALAHGLSLAALLIIQVLQQRIPVETFRVLTDSALLIGPAAALLLHL
jgi:hypothetical protein